MFTSGDAAKLTLRELTNNNNPESGPIISVANVNAIILNEKKDQDVIFPQSVTLSTNKSYIFIVESANDQTILNLVYSLKNPKKEGSLFELNNNGVPTKGQAWSNVPDGDVYFELIK